MKNLKRHTRLDFSGFDDKAIRQKYDRKCDGKISRSKMASSMNSDVKNDILGSIMTNNNYLLENNGGMLKHPLKEIKSQFNNNQNSSSRRNQKPDKTLKSIMLKPSKAFRFEVGSNRNAEAPKTKLQKIKDEISKAQSELNPREIIEKQQIRLNGLNNQLNAEMTAVAANAKVKAMKLYEESGWTGSSMFNNFMDTIVGYIGWGSRKREISETDVPIKSFEELRKERLQIKARIDEHLAVELNYPDIANLTTIKWPDPVGRFSREDEDDDDVFD